MPAIRSKSPGDIPYECIYDQNVYQGKGANESIIDEPNEKLAPPN